MSGSDPEKHTNAPIWFAGAVALVAVGAAMQDRPITIAASDNPPSISTPVTGIDARRAQEQRTKSVSPPPGAQPGTQIFYGGWSVHQ
jgi:hypothetical protein